MAAKKLPTPKAVVTKTVCSECDLDWDKHPENPTLQDCVALLKAQAKMHVFKEPYTIPIKQRTPIWEGPLAPYRIWSESGTYPTKVTASLGKGSK